MQQDWDTLERLFSEAMELPRAERVRFVKENCGDNAWLRQELETLLEAPEGTVDAAFDTGKGIVQELLAALDTEYAVGREIGGYRIGQLISSGGMGVVYRAVELASGETVALKMLPPEDVRNANRIRRLAREAAALRMLNHPGIVKIKTYHAEPDGHFLAMELVEGETLKAVLARGPVRLGQALDWGEQISAAVEAAHAQGVVHRDLKPSNVMIESAPEGPGRVKLLDFGLARVPDGPGPATHTQTTVDGTVAGTFSYFSPEQARGERGDERSDIFSFGAILYEMLAGRGAFERATAVATAAAVLSEKPLPLPAEVPGAVKTLVERCLEKEPARRFESISSVRAELVRLRDLEGGGRLKPRVTAKRRVAIAAAGALLAVAGAAWLWSRSNGPAEPPSIAVLPFTNASGDAASQYIVDGLTDELTTALKKDRAVTVAEASAAAAYKKTPRDLADIGRNLRVTYLVEANVERAGDYLKVVASLERASGGKVWTNTYQRPTGDLNDIEADLAAGVRGSLGLSKAANAADSFIPSEQAHDMFLKARFEDDGSSVASLERAQRDYEGAIALEPRYAAAYSGLAGTFWNRHIIAGQNPARDDLRKAAGFWQKAVDLDPRLASAHSGLAGYVMQYDWDWDHAERELKAALAEGPDVAAESNYAWLCLILGRLTEADAHLRRARDADQLSWKTSATSASIFRLERRFAEAREEAQKLAVRNPTAIGPNLILGLSYAEEGNPDECIRMLKPSVPKQPNMAMPLAWCEAMAGNREEAMKSLRPLEEHFDESHLQNDYFAMAYAAMGDEPNTVKWLERSMEAREYQAVYIRVEPMFAALQDTPEFHALKKRMNLDW